MKKIILSFFFFNFLFGQNFEIKDKLTKEAIPFVDIVYYKNNEKIKFSYSDIDGNFSIEDKNFDFFTINVLGYKERKIDFLPKEKIIFLEQDTILLKEIVISNIKNTENIGLVYEPKIIEMSGFSGFEECLYIKNPYNYKKKVKAILFKGKYKSKSDVFIRLNFYNRQDESIFPGKELLNINLIFNLKNLKRKNTFQIDVSEYDVLIPKEGFFVGIEYVGDKKSYGENIEIKIEHNATQLDTFTFCRNKYKLKDWIELNSTFRGMNIKKIDNKILNISLGVEVYE
ncbi:MAG: hypothetical protein R2790_00090 [Flavobacterium haoranii]